MKAIRITIANEPVAKGRPKTRLINGEVRTYTPHKTKQAQISITDRLARHQDKAFVSHIPVKLTVIFFRTKSKYLPARETLPFRKPDLDNFLKLVIDAMNGVLIADDAQITSITTKKRWSNNGHGHIEIRLEKDGDND